MSEPTAWPARGTTRALQGLALLVSVALLVWRLWCIGVGPDRDTDAYGHYVIARQLLETPENLRIHWVWLPLYHLLLALGVAADVSIDGVRVMNALLATVPPLLLLAWAPSAHHGSAVRSAQGREASASQPSTVSAPAVAVLAALLAALASIAVQLGTSAQPESLFIVLVLGGALLLAHGRAWGAAALFSAAALMRYEAWAAVAAIAVVLAYRRVVRARPLVAGEVACVVAPAACALAWALARWVTGEPLLGFIRDNQRFAEAALAHVSGGWRALPAVRVISDGPLPIVGAFAALAVIGALRAVRRGGTWLVAVPLGICAFLVASALNRSQLGLPRHLVSLVPFIALWIAHGAAAVAELAARARPELERRARVGFALLGLGLCLSMGNYLRLELERWVALTRAALPSQRAAAVYLQSLPSDALIVCDEAAAEVLSGLPRERFVRFFVEERARGAVLDLARRRPVYVVSVRRRLSHLIDLGTVTHGELAGAPDDVLVLRVRAPRSSEPPALTRAAEP